MYRNARHFSIRTLLIVLVLSSAVPLLAFFSLFNYQLLETEVRDAERGAVALAEAAAAGIHQFLEDTERALQTLARDPEIRSMDPERCLRRLEELAPLFLPTYTNLAVTDSTGFGFCSILSGGEEPPLPPGGRPWHAGAIPSTGFVVGPVQEGRISGRWVSVLTYPVLADDGRFLGVVALPVDLVRFESLLNELHPPGDMILTVAERTGTVVARSRNSSRWVGRKLPGWDPRSRDDPRTARRGISRAKTLEGTDFVWGFAGIPGSDWQVFVGRPWPSVYGSIRARWIRLVLLGLAVLVLSSMAALVVYRRIAHPLAALVEETQAAADRTPFRPVPVEGPREIAEVASRLNDAWLRRMRAEEEKDRSAARVQSILEHAALGIYVATESGRFVEVNPALASMLAYDGPEELLEQPVERLFRDPGDRARLLEAARREGGFRDAEVEWMRKDGRPITVRLTGSRREGEDGEPRLEVIAEDVTERRAMEERALQSRKMEALGRLAGGIAHDFNNILTIIQGQAEILAEELRDTELGASALEIFEAGSRGAALTGQLLAFARGGTTEEGTADLDRVVHRFEPMLRRTLGEDVDLVFDLGSGGALVEVEESQLEQVLLNLVVNARDALPAGGRITVRTHRVQVSRQEAARRADARSGPHAVLTVEDTGHGIDPSALPRIFEPFYSTKGGVKGTGLGLATVYGIVTRRGGHIVVESELGRGSRFHVHLPLVGADTRCADPDRGEGTHADLPTHPRFRKGSILVVEDEDPVRRLVARVLRREGLEVLEAEGAAEARRLLQTREAPVDLLLTDVVMPGTRGPELAARLVREGRVRHVILMSGYPDGLDATPPRGRSWVFMPKPFSPGMLLEAVQRLLSRQPGETPGEAAGGAGERPVAAGGTGDAPEASDAAAPQPPPAPDPAR